MCLVTGEPVCPGASLALQVGVLAHHDVLRVVRGVTGLLGMGVGKLSQLGPDTLGVGPGGVIPGRVLEKDDLGGPARLDRVLSGLHHGAGGRHGLGHVVVDDPKRHVLIGYIHCRGPQQNSVIFLLIQLLSENFGHIPMGLEGFIEII